MLIRDIVVRPEDGELASRLEIYREGTAHHPHEAKFGPQLYRAGAFLPRGRAMRASPAEIEMLDGTRGAPDRSHTIGVLRLPAALVSDLRAARAGEGQVTEEQLRSYPFNRLPEAIEPGWKTEGALIALGYGHTPPGFKTVTYDARAERFIGLHIDDLDEQPLRRRAGSTARLCVNLGSSCRHLLFINLGVGRMAELLSVCPAMRPTPLIHAFLRKFPQYPVMRLAVLPGEAYIAPTENMIHDGTTECMTVLDQQVTVRGRLDPR